MQNFDNDFDTKRRVIHLSAEKNMDDFIGFNIRGGSEYGLGIYVSRYSLYFSPSYIYCILYHLIIYYIYL